MGELQISTNSFLPSVVLMGRWKKRKVTWWLLGATVAVIMIIILNKASKVRPEGVIQPVRSLSAADKKSLLLDNDVSEATSTSTAPHLHIRGQSSNMPLWMRDYFQFHTEQRKSADEPKYLVVSCIPTLKGGCGGTADRLKPIPYYLLLANRSRRVLLIRWTKPCPLENWLQPLDGGIDWRAPASVQHAVDSAKRVDIAGSFGQKQLLRGDLDSKQIVTIKLQVTDGCMDLYSKTIGAAALDFSEFINLYGDMFRSMFAPVPTIADSMQKTMKRLKLEPDKYVSAHLRARHPNTARRHVAKSVDKEGGFKLEGSFRKQIYDLATNAVNCAGYVSPTGPIYFASDSHDAVRYIVNESPFAQPGSGIVVSGNVQEEEPLHLDTPDFKKHKCDAFNSVFEDLLILGSSKCVVVGCGGYGRFGQLLSFNSSCRARHQHYEGYPEFNGKKHALCPSLLKSI